MSRHVRDAVLVDGLSAHVLWRVASSPTVRQLLGAMPPWARTEMAATLDALRRASDAYLGRPVAAYGSAETEVPDPVPPFGLSDADWLDSRQAAEVLHLTPRRVRQLAAGGLGQRRAGRWLLDRGAVEALAQTRHGRQADDGHEGAA